MDDFEELSEYSGSRLTSDQMEIKLAYLHAQTQAIEQRTRAIDKLTEAHLRNAEAMERALKALQDLDTAGLTERKPPSRVLRIEKRKRG